MRAAVTIRKASAYLTSFDAPTPANDAHDASHASVSPVDDPAPVPADPTSVGGEPENLNEDSLRPQYAVSTPEEIAAEIETKIVAAVEAERQAAEERLRQAREDWTTEMADSLARRLEQSMGEAIDSIRDDVARILAPFISREVFRQSLEEMTASVKKGLVGAIDPAIKISGPADVIDKVSRALADRDIAIIAHESDRMDARVLFGSTTIETALEAWLAQLASTRKGER